MCLFKKLSSKTWKGVVKKNKFDLPADHENKIGVGTNSLTYRAVSANGTILPTSNTAASAAALSQSQSSKAKSSAAASSSSSSSSHHRR